jgi:hypothetical protein
MIPKPIPLRSLRDLPPLTWAEIEYGYSHQLIGWRTVVDIAASKLAEGSNDPIEIELAGVGKDTDWKIDSLIQRLAEKEPPKAESELAGAWLFVSLKWLYENKMNFPNPLREVEELYADYGYPSTISQFVGFLPPTDGYQPELHTREENEERLYNLWANYLRSTARRLLTQPT